MGWISTTLNARLPEKTDKRNIPSALLLKNGFVLLPLLVSFFNGYRPPSMVDCSTQTHNRRHSICHFHLKWLRTFAAFGVILNGYRPPSMGDYPRQTRHRKHSICHFHLKWPRTFAALWGHFLMDIDRPQRTATPDKPAIETFYLSFSFKMASDFCRLWGSFFNGYRPPSMDDYPRQTHNRKHSICHFTSKWLRIFCCFRGSFGWISTTLNGRLPQTNPKSQTFHLPF